MKLILKSSFYLLNNDKLVLSHELSHPTWAIPKKTIVTADMCKAGQADVSQSRKSNLGLLQSCHLVP